MNRGNRPSPMCKNLACRAVQNHLTTAATLALKAVWLPPRVFAPCATISPSPSGVVVIANRDPRRRGRTHLSLLESFVQSTGWDDGGYAPPSGPPNKQKEGEALEYPYGNFNITASFLNVLFLGYFGNAFI